MVDPEYLACSAHSGLNLVGDQEHIVVITDVTKPRPEVIGRYDGTGFALYRLGHDRRNAVTHGLCACQHLLPLHLRRRKEHV